MNKPGCSSRRLFQATALLVVFAGLYTSRADEADDPVQLTEAAKRIHASALVFDSQNGLAGFLRNKGDLHFRTYDISQPQKELRTDIPRLRAGGVDAEIFSIYVPPSSARDGTAVKEVHEQIDLLHRLVQTYPTTFEIAYKAEDIQRLHRAGKIAVLIGIEGGHSIDNSLGILRNYYRMGARFLTLTNTDNCDWADAALDHPKHQGLSKFGEEVVKEMNRLGMVIDLSHASLDTMKHTLLLSRAPIIFSHTASHALAPHPRNVPDEILRMVAKNGGVVNVNFYTAFLTPEGIKAYEERTKAAHKLRAAYPNDNQYRLALAQLLRERPLPPCDVRTVVNHIDHIVEVAGIDHVGLGSNFDGMGTAPRQLEDVSYFPYLTQELLNRGYTQDQINKILGGNMLRVLRQAEIVAQDTERAGR
ncbi:MAG: dipeptidase [Gemmataceae bacterium]